MRRLAELEDKIGSTERRLTEIREELTSLEKQVIDERDLKKALSLFDPIWHELYPKEKARIMQLLIERIDYHGGESPMRHSRFGDGAGKLAITFHDAGIKTLAEELEETQEPSSVCV